VEAEQLVFIAGVDAYGFDERLVLVAFR